MNLSAIQFTPTLNQK